MLKHKKAAIELGMTTIVVVVLSVVILILGFVFLRSIMCGAIGFTQDLNKKIENEINSLFETSRGEVVCIGSQEAKTMPPGTNYIYCSINSPQGGRYEIKMIKISSTNMPNNIDLNDWVPSQRDSWGPREVSPSSREPIKAITLEIPDDAPEGSIRLEIEAYKNGDLVSPMDLDFKISRQGVIRSILC
ncbi:MAG: hypothetical protein WC533_00610 [Candidatus Pacearchaeota archaeon]